MDVMDENTSPGPGQDDLSAQGQDMGAGASPEADEENQEGGPTPVFLTPDMLPAGHKCKAGDIIQFKVVNPADADGHIEVVFNSEEEQGEGDTWEDGMRKYMSARNNGAEPPPEPESGSY